MMDYTLDCALEEISRHVCDVEILSDGNHSLFFNEEICYSYDLKYAVHAPSGETNIAVENERMRKAAMQVVSELVDICDNIGAEILVLHPGFMIRPETRFQAERSLQRSLKELAIIQKECNVNITIENMSDLNILFFRKPDFLDVLEYLGLGFTLDVGHANVNGNLNEFLSEGRPVHVHLHDNISTWDTHDPCGEGNIDFGSVLASLPNNAMKIIEVNSFCKFEKSMDHISNFISPY